MIHLKNIYIDVGHNHAVKKVCFKKNIGKIFMKVALFSSSFASRLFFVFRARSFLFIPTIIRVFIDLFRFRNLAVLCLAPHSFLNEMFRNRRRNVNARRNSILSFSRAHGTIFPPITTAGCGRR